MLLTPGSVRLELDNMAEPNLQEIHDFLISLASKAGEMITTAHPSMSNIDTKKNCKFPESPYDIPHHSHLLISLPASDLVTETDQAVEHMVSTSLKSAYPSYECVSHLPASSPPRVYNPTST